VNQKHGAFERVKRGVFVAAWTAHTQTRFSALVIQFGEVAPLRIEQ
jgi:hypothetical protein